MKIAVLGAGRIGGTLGKKWAQAGHQVAFGVRAPDDIKWRTLLESINSTAAVDTVAGAIAFGELVLFSIPGTTVHATVEVHAKALNDKIIIDATNRFGSPEISALSTFRAKTPQALLFRAFNSLGWEVFAEPRFGEVRANLLYCGPDNQARPSIERLISEVGLVPIWAGDLDQIQLVDNLGALWMTLALRRGMGRHLAFQVLSDSAMK